MAQPASHEASAQAAPTSLGNPPNAGSEPGVGNMSFQAINSRLPPENARLASPAVANHRASSSDLTPPTSDAVSALHASQPAPIPASTAQPSNTAMQVDGLDGTMDASYGTRSRNRTNARPNYAEDQDMDFEFSSAATTTTTTTTTRKKTADAPSAQAGGPSDARRTQGGPSFQAVNANGSNVLTHAKESTPGSGPIASVPKKRKAAGTSASTLQTPTASSTPPPAAARRPAGSIPANMARETNVMTFSKHRSCLNKKGELVADDGTKLCVNDHVYLVCEPPGDPYYLCRIMEFLHVDSDNPNSPVDSLRVNWYYRPRDVQRFNSDTRLVYGTMHSDMCPLTSLRGKCMIKHRSEIDDLDAYRKERDHFYFVQVFDRFIRRSYECIPVQQIINVPEKVKKALDERWKFVVVEIGRVKELTSAAKTCKRCARYCASNDSVDCAICKNSYHMNCVQPPLPKKPSRGFAWACGPCSRASEKKAEAHSTPTASGNATEADEEEPVEEEVPAASNDTTRAPSPSDSDMIIDDHPATQAEIALAKMWPMRYLGIHARVEDALQYDDRAIYPRASSRLGPRHQASVNMWHGRPVELVKAAEIKKRYNKGPVGKKEGKLTKETLAAMEADREEKAKRPKWVQDEPAGYVARGEDYDPKDPRCTAKLMFRMPSIEENPKAVQGEQHEPTSVRQGKFIDDYLRRAKGLSKMVGVPPFGTNFLDKALELLTATNYNVDAALKQLQKVDRVKDLHEPVLSKSDLVKFEEGVSKYGSEHRLIRLHMKTHLPNSDVVRFYYLWKKTPKGREIWGNYGGRKKRKADNDTGSRLQAELANDVDDSAFDNEKAVRKNRAFQCKFCSTQFSRQWRRAPGVSPGQLAAPDSKNGKADKKDRPLLALCLRCAGLWRKYAIQWEDMDEVAKKIASGGGRALKRKIDEELLRELQAANDATNMPTHEQHAFVHAVDGVEPPKKKSKVDRDAGQAGAATAAKKERPPPPPKEPTPPPPPIIPAQPTWKQLPCAVCRVYGETIACAHCKLTVHRRCFGLREDEGVRANGDVKWICEQCQNDRNPTVSTDYSCCLCLTEETLVDLVEPPKVSHKKKTDREREKERLEKELADGMRAEYRSRQLAHNRPVMPREPLKRTTGNNWVHVYCAVWAPEIRFSNAKALEVAEGFQLIPQPRYEAVCKLCKNKDHNNKVREDAGACVNCFQCSASFHASCAFEAGYTFGFDVSPVKSSRKDQIITATLGQETGALTAVILCKEHATKNIIHPMNEVADESGRTSLQVFAENYKQADLTLTGTVRKAAQAQLTKEKGQQPNVSAQNANRRESTAHSIAAAVRRGARTSSIAETKAEADDSEVSSMPDAPEQRRCVKCGIDVTPKWHPLVKDVPPEEPLEKVPQPSAATGDDHANDDKPGAFDDQGTSPSRTSPYSTLGNPGANVASLHDQSERYGSRPPVDGQLKPSDDSGRVGIPVGPPIAPVRDVKGEATLQAPHSEAQTQDGSMRQDTNGPDSDEVYHSHALPQFQNPAANSTPPLHEPEEPKEDEQPRDFLCHKCFLKKKLDPTPPSDDRDRMDTSPPRTLPIPLDSHTRSSQPAAMQTIEQQFEIWDRPPRPTPAPPMAPAPSMNGYPPAPHYGPPHLGGLPPNPAYPPQPPSFGQQPNGYGQPPHAGHHPMHERHNSYGYPPQHSPNPQNPYAAAPPSHSRAPHVNGYGGQSSQHMANGLSSPRHGGPPPMQSPSWISGSLHQPQHQVQHQMQHQPQHPAQHQTPQQTSQVPRPDSAYPVQLPPVAPPLHSSPNAPFGRPGPPSQTSQNPSGLPPRHQQQTPQPQAASPRPEAVRPDGQTPRPTTPRTSQANGTPNTTGASASPNLMNLIH